MKKRKTGIEIKIDSIGRRQVIDHDKLSAAQRRALKRPEVQENRVKGAKKRSKRISYLWNETDTYANVHTEEANRKRAEAYSRFYKNNPDKLEEKCKRMRSTYATGIPNEKISKALLAAWEDPIKGLNLIRGITKRPNSKWSTKMNSPELDLYGVLKSLGYKYKWTGGGRGRVLHYVPDFMHSHFHWIVELYGSYWHGRDDIKEHDRRRQREIRRAGYKLLIVWETELKEPERLVKRIRKFHKVALHRI